MMEIGMAVDSRKLERPKRFAACVASCFDDLRAGWLMIKDIPKLTAAMTEEIRKITLKSTRRLNRIPMRGPNAVASI